MENNLIKNLETTGLSQKESSVYLALLEIGQASIASLSLKTVIKRPTCYLIIDELVQKGLVTSVPVGRKTLYIAEHPTKIVKRAERSLSVAKNIVSGLQEIMTKKSDRPKLRVFNGKSGVQSIYEDILTVGKDLYYIASVKDLVAAVGEEYLDSFISRRISKGMKSFSIRMESTEIVRDNYGDQPENLRTVRYAPESFDTPYSIFIFGDNVAFISREIDSFGFLVESRDLSKTIKSMFDSIWSISKEKKFETTSK